MTQPISSAPVRRVAVVGGGIAGLYAALLLQSKGINVHIFEASDRIGGRIWTYRFNEDEDQFFEAGAMRIPRSSFHQPVLDIISFVNSKLGSNHIETIPYILHSTGNRVFVNGRCKENGSYFSLAELNDLTAERLGFDLPSPYADQTAHQLLQRVLQPFVNALRSDFATGFSKILQYDDLSFRMYLRTVAQWPAEVIDFVEVMLAQTNQYALSFPEIIIQNMDFATLEWFTIKGGMDRLPNAMGRIIGPQNITLNARVSGFSETDTGRVSLRFDSPNAPAAETTFDSVILALPPAAVRMLQDRPRWSPSKEAAIRSIHFEPLYKLGLRFKTRFWERISHPSFGGQSITDLTSRWVVYPSNGIGEQGPGVLLLYSWMTDALVWLPLSEMEQIEHALNDLSKLYGKEISVHDEFIEGKVVCWSKWSCGDAMFLPGQYTAYSAAAAEPEGNVYFAGEHLSQHHTWISGAIHSARTTVCTMTGDNSIGFLC